MGDIFVSININNWGPKTVVVKNVHLFWGKFYKDSKSPQSLPRLPVSSARAGVVVPIAIS